MGVCVTLIFLQYTGTGDTLKPIFLATAVIRSLFLIVENDNYTDLRSFFQWFMHTNMFRQYIRLVQSDVIESIIVMATPHVC